MESPSESIPTHVKMWSSIIIQGDTSSVMPSSTPQTHCPTSTPLLWYLSIPVFQTVLWMSYPYHNFVKGLLQITWPNTSTLSTLTSWIIQSAGYPMMYKSPIPHIWHTLSAFWCMFDRKLSIQAFFRLSKTSSPLHKSVIVRHSVWANLSQVPTGHRWRTKADPDVNDQWTPPHSHWTDGLHQPHAWHHDGADFEPELQTKTSPLYMHIFAQSLTSTEVSQFCQVMECTVCHDI